MVAITDAPPNSERPVELPVRSWSLTRVSVDAVLLLLCGAILWALVSRSLLLVGVAVTVCILAGAAALARFGWTPRQATASAIACSSLATAVLVSTPGLWTTETTAAAAFVLLGAIALCSSGAQRSAAGYGRPLALSGAAVLLGPVWAVLEDDDAVSLPTALRALAVVTALIAAGISRHDRRSAASNVVVAIVAILGSARVDLRELELAGITCIGALALDRWWRLPHGPSGAPRKFDGGIGPAARPLAAAASLLIALGWICVLSRSWNAVVVLSAGLLAVAVAALDGFPVTAWELARRLGSLDRVAREIARRSQIDGLTNLPNRQAFERRLAEETERAVRYRQPLALCFVDIDHFKSINDTHGHRTGDDVLAMVAETLRATARTIDIVARYGGEEFVVIAPGTWTSDAIVLAERLRLRVSSLRLAELTGAVTISVGVAGLPEHATDADSLLRRADAALYDAKRRGRDRTSIAPPDVVTGRV